MKKVEDWGLIIIMSVIVFLIAFGVISTLRTVNNRQLLDVTFSFERAIVSLPNGSVVEGKVTSWKDFEDGDQIQVKIDGVTYLTHINNVCLISE